MSNNSFARTAGGKTKRRKHGGGPTFIQIYHWMVDMPVCIRSRHAPWSPI
jgi:hypothetical protein